MPYSTPLHNVVFDLFALFHEKAFADQAFVVCLSWSNKILILLDKIYFILLYYVLMLYSLFSDCHNPPSPCFILWHGTCDKSISNTLQAIGQSNNEPDRSSWAHGEERYFGHRFFLLDNCILVWEKQTFSDDEDHLLVCVCFGRAQAELRFC